MGERPDLKLQSLKNFLTDGNSEESTDYIAKLLAGKLKRPEETFVHIFLNDAFWEERGYLREERNFEAPAGEGGRVEGSLEIEGKKIAIECKKPYEVRKDKAEINDLDGDDINELTNQIEKYLQNHDLIIFTNGFHWFFYSRESYRAWIINKDKKENELTPYFKHLTHDEIFNKNSSQYIENFLNRDNILETLSSYEDKFIRHVLTDEFYEDLKTWVGFIDVVLRDTPANTRARTTSLINKLIFVRTMEGTGVIPNGFLNEKWGEKSGVRNSTVNFIDNIDDELSETYDTELFTPKYVEDKDGEIKLENNIPVFSPQRRKNYAYKALPESFFSALLKKQDEFNPKDTGITKIIHGGKEYYIRSLYWWKFENLSADILGKSYETYLADFRKRLGIYYTPNKMTKYIVQHTVGVLFDKKISEMELELNKNNWDIEKIKSISHSIVDIKICDPSCGSGSFLIQALRVVWSKYKLIEKIIYSNDSKLNKSSSSLDDFADQKFGLIHHLGIIFRIKDKQERLGTLILRHIHGNDKDIQAIDTAKLNIWLECLRLDPNSFRKEIVKGKRHVLPNLELNLTVGDSLVGFDVKDADKELSIMKDSVKAIFEHVQKYSESFENTSIANTAVEYRESLKGILDFQWSEKMKVDDARKLLEIASTTHWSLQHLSAFYDKNGNLKDSSEQGFDVIIGNPPWEVLKPNILEFFSPAYNFTHDERFRTISKDKKDEFIKEQLKTPQIKNQWDNYQKEITLYANHLNSSGDYKYQQAVIDGKKSRGDNNLYKFFFEKSYNLLKKNGSCGLVIPANLYSDLGTKGLRELLFYKSEIVSLYQFDNTKGIFDGIDSRTKFITLVFKKGSITTSFKSAFFQNDVEKLSELDDTSYLYELDLVKKASPIALSVIECGSKIEVDIIKKLFKNKILLENPKFHIKFVQADFHTTKDAEIFNTKEEGPVLYQGGMIHQFTNDFGPPKYWVDEDKAIEKLKIKETSRVKRNYKVDPNNIGKIPLDFEHFRIAWRNIARGTDARTMIATILPKNSFTAHSLSYIAPTFYDGEKFIPSIQTKDLLLLCGLLNSFVLDYVLRHKVDKNVSMFFVYELPIISYKESEFLVNEIISRVGGLICTTPEYDKLLEGIDIKKKFLDPNERMVSMAEINAFVAKLYGLNLDEITHVLKNFRIVDEKFKQKTIEIFNSLKD